jgi:hypothetical protein
MTAQELQTIETEAYELLNYTLHNARTLYTKNNAKFNIGEYIRSVNGIIKVEEIRYQNDMGTTRTEYCGYKYYYKNKQLIRTKKQEQICITDYNNIINVDQCKI